MLLGEMRGGGGPHQICLAGVADNVCYLYWANMHLHA